MELLEISGLIINIQVVVWELDDTKFGKKLLT